MNGIRINGLGNANYNMSMVLEGIGLRVNGLMLD